MDVVVVFKSDGTIQQQACCPVPLEHHAAELRKAGASKILGQANVPGPFATIEQTGASTGRVNAYAIPREDWECIGRGAVCRLGFRLWTGVPYPDLALAADCRIGTSDRTGSRGTSLARSPVLIRELLGRRCRCYEQGTLLGDDFLPDRVNIEWDERGRIADVWLG